MSGTEIGGRAWFDGTGRVLRADYLRGEVVLDSEFWVKLAQLLDKVCRVCGDRQDIEFAVRAKGWSYSRHARLRPRVALSKFHRRGGWPASRPEAGRSGSRAFLIAGMSIRRVTRSICACGWELSVSKPVWTCLIPSGLLRGSEASLVVLDSVPIQVDPASGRDATAVEVFHSEAQADLAETINRGTREVCRIQMETVPFHQADDRRLLDTIASVAAVYREMAVTRLGAMQQWIEGEARAMGEF